MFRRTTIAVSSASRRTLQHLLPTVRNYSYTNANANANASFTIHTPKPHKHRARTVQQHARRAAPSNPPRRAAVNSTRRLLVLAPTCVERAGDGRVVGLQRAIDGQDVAEIWSVWKSVGDAGCGVGREGYRKLLRVCESYGVRVRGVREQEWKVWLGEVAMAASLTGDVDLIAAYFRLLIRNRQPEQVVSIWKRIVHKRIEAGATPSSCHSTRSESTTAEEAQVGMHDVAGEKFIRLDESVQGERIDLHDVVCLVTFAHTLAPDTDQLVTLFEPVELGSPFRLFFNQTRAKKLYDSLQQTDAGLRDWNEMQTELWQVELARGVASGSGGEQRIARLLGSLFQLRQVDEAYAVFQSAMRASRAPLGWLSLACVPNPSLHCDRVEWTEACWSICLTNLIGFGRTDLAMDVWKCFQQARLCATPHIWNALLDGYGRAKNYAAVVHTWKAALQYVESQSGSNQACIPDEQMYTTMISILFRTKRCDEAMALVSEMVARSERDGARLGLWVETFNAVVHGLLVNGRQAQAERVFEQMQANGPAPNIGTINTLLRAYSRVGEMHSVASMLRLAHRLGLVPDVVTFTTVLDALLRKGGESASESVVKTLGIMSSMRVQPNTVTYTAMIKACLEGAKATQLDMASQSMFGNPTHHSKPLDDGADHQVRIEAALELLDRMLIAKVSPSEITYTALIAGCLQNPDAVLHALTTQTIPRHYLTPPKPLAHLGETNSTVQTWLHNTPEVSLSLLLLETMKTRGLPPTPTTFRCLIEGLCSPRTDQPAFIRSMHLLDEMLQPPATACPPSLGPFVSSAMGLNHVRSGTMLPVSHKTWIVVFNSLIDRFENGTRTGGGREMCGRALSTAVRIVRETVSLHGIDGGLSLSRLVERAGLLTVRLARSY